MRCRDQILAALRAQMAHRNDHPDWMHRERVAIATAATMYALAHGLRAVTVMDVERIEHAAVGHFDYASKISLYISEMVHGDPFRL
jgi:nitrate reductase assembly molybdenum cofactor insertion protein NarJ